MFLKNNSRRLITVNIPKFKVDPKSGKSIFHKYEGIQIKPGNNPAVEFEDDFVNDSKFIKSLIKSGDLSMVLDEDEDGENEDDLSKKTKAELIEIAVMMGLEVDNSLKKAEIIDLIQGQSE